MVEVSFGTNHLAQLKLAHLFLIPDQTVEKSLQFGFASDGSVLDLPEQQPAATEKYSLFIPQGGYLPRLFRHLYIKHPLSYLAHRKVTTLEESPTAHKLDEPDLFRGQPPLLLQMVVQLYILCSPPLSACRLSTQNQLGLLSSFERTHSVSVLDYQGLAITLLHCDQSGLDSIPPAHWRAFEAWNCPQAAAE